MSAPIFDYIKGKSNLSFFQDLNMVPDTAISPTDTKDIYLSKCQRRLGILFKVKSMIDSDGFRALEEVLMMRVKKLDSDIWGELLAQNDKRVNAMVIERTGIVSFFTALESIDKDIETMEQSVASLESGDDPRTPIQEGELSA